MVSPLALVRNEGRKKRDALKRIRYINANALGILLGEGLSNERLVLPRAMANPSVTSRDEIGVEDGN